MPYLLSVYCVTAASGLETNKSGVGLMQRQRLLKETLYVYPGATLQRVVINVYGTKPRYTVT